MSNKLKKEIENLTEIVKRHPEGISMEKLLEFMNDVTPRRTVQYRLSILVKSGILRIEGAGRNSKYYLNLAVENKQTVESADTIQTTFTIPLSFEGEEVRKQPDPFRVRYRDLIRQTVFTVVQNKMDRLKSSQFISKFANENISSEDRNRFVEIAEIEVSSLHEGNFARFKIKPSKFFEWQSSWK